MCRAPNLRWRERIGTRCGNLTRCRSEGGVGKRKNTKQTLAEAESTNPGRVTARDESSFTPLVSEALFTVEMNTVSMSTGDAKQLDNA